MHKRSSTRHTDSPTQKWGDLPSNSLSLFARLPFLGGMAAGGLTLLRPTGDAANQATNVRSLGQVQPGGYSGQTSVSPDKAMNLPLRSDNPSAPSRCRGRLKQQRQQQQEGIYHEHHLLSYHAFLKNPLQGGDKKHQQHNHALPEKKRDGSPERSLLAQRLSRRFNMTSRFIHVYSST